MADLADSEVRPIYTLSSLRLGGMTKVGAVPHSLLFAFGPAAQPCHSNTLRLGTMKASLFVLLKLALTPAEAFVRPSAPHDSVPTSLHAQSKAQPKVAIDPKTGLYRPMKRVPGRDASGKETGPGWDGFKEAVYKGVDGLSSLPSALGQIGSKKDNNLNKVVGGYAEKEKELGATAAAPLRTPVEKLLKITESTEDPSDKPLIPPTNLEKAKAFFWNSIDAARQAKKDKKSSSSNTISTTMGSFHPTVRARLISSDDFLAALEDLESPNPVVRLAAGRRIKKLAQTQQNQLATNPFTQLKTKVYQAADQIQATGQQIAALPSKAVETYEATVATTRKAVAQAQQVPSQVEAKVKAAQQSIDDTVQTTQKAVETVQKLPATIQTSIQTTKADVQAKVQATVDTANNVKNTVESVTTNTKVLLGLEKPKPKPPTTPPPEPWTAQRVAWKLLSVSANVAAQTGWWVGKNGAKLAWKVGSVAAEKGSAAVKEQMEEYQKTQSKKLASSSGKAKTVAPPAVKASTTVAPPEKTTPAAKPKSIATAQSVGKFDSDIPPTQVDLKAKAAQQAEEMSALELEIEEALRLADAAIQSAQDEIAQEEQKRKDDKEGSQS